MANIPNCTLVACDLSNLSRMEQVDMEMVRQDLIEFGLDDLFNVVAYSVMSGGKKMLRRWEFPQRNFTPNLIFVFSENHMHSFRTLGQSLLGEK